MQDAVVTLPGMKKYIVLSLIFDINGFVSRQCQNAFNSLYKR